MTPPGDGFDYDLAAMMYPDPPVSPEERAALRRHAWWGREAFRPPGAEMISYSIGPDESEGPVDPADVEQVRQVVTRQLGDQALTVVMSDMEADYWGFHGPVRGTPDSRWVVTATYRLTGEHAGRSAVQVLLTVGDKAELVTPLHSAQGPLDVPAGRITADTGVEDLPGKWFSVEVLGGADASGFRLIREL